jgi:hypothetical protein
VPDGDVRARRQGVGEVAGELLNPVAGGSRAAAVPAQVRGQDPVAPADEVRLDRVPGSMVGNQAVDEQRGSRPVPGSVQFEPDSWAPF